MKPDDVAGSRARQVRQQTKRELIKRTLLRDRMIARREERRIHGPPTHDQVYKQPQRRLVKEPSAHGKEKLFAPFRQAKEHRRHGVHIEERTMIRHQQQRSLARRSLDVLEAVDGHDVVGREMNPPGPHRALTPRPEAFPPAAIHAARETIGKPFKRRKDGEFFGGGNDGG